MIAFLLAWLLQSVPHQPSPPQPPALAAAQRAVNDSGEAYGRCLMAVALDRSASVAEEDALFDAALAACPDEEAAAMTSYGDYLRLVGIEASPQQVREMFAAQRPAIRQRILGCVAVARAAQAEGGERRMC